MTLSFVFALFMKSGSDRNQNQRCERASLGYKMNAIRVVYVNLVIFNKMISECVRNLITSLGAQGRTPTEILGIVGTICKLSTIKRVLSDPDHLRQKKESAGQSQKLREILHGG